MRSSSSSQSCVCRLNIKVRLALLGSVAWTRPSVSLQMRYESTVPNRISPRSARPQSGVFFQQVLHFGAGKIRVQQQPGLVAKQRLQAVLLQPFADAGTDAALPNHSVVDRPTGLSLPKNRGFALVCQTDGRNLIGLQVALGECLLGYLGL